jgi:DNA-binding response OmpR family regulator
MPRRVFIVDDEKTIADTLGVILRQSGYEAHVFYDAQSALLQLDSVLPDLVITDVVMPQMTGVELAVVIKQRHPACKILLFSGNARTSDLLADVREQGHDFELLAKPIYPTDLLARIANVQQFPSC